MGKYGPPWCITVVQCNPKRKAVVSRDNKPHVVPSSSVLVDEHKIANTSTWRTDFNKISIAPSSQ